MVKENVSFGAYLYSARNNAANKGFDPDNLIVERELAEYLRNEDIKSSCKFDALADYLSKEGEFYDG